MPHFGIVDEERLGPEAAMLLRARVHMRSARRRLRQGMLKEGMATLYDAVDSAMSWYAMRPDRRAGLIIPAGVDIRDADTLHRALRQAGVLSDALDFVLLRESAEGLQRGDVRSGTVEVDGLLEGAEQAFMELGVSPFDEAELPPEHPDIR